MQDWDWSLRMPPDIAKADFLESAGDMQLSDSGVMTSPFVMDAWPIGQSRAPTSQLSGTASGSSSKF